MDATVPKQQQDRIDFIYYRGNQLVTRDAVVIDEHAEKFPSDHAAMMTEFSRVEPKFYRPCVWCLTTSNMAWETTVA